jgi:hypothetical protein
MTAPCAAGGAGALFRALLAPDFRGLQFMIRVILLAVVVTASFVQASAACDRCGRHNACLCCEVCELECCPCQLAEHTIMVPMKILETQMKVEIVETMKEREESYTVFQPTTKKRKFTKECCYLEKEVKTQPITKTSCRVVDSPTTLVDSVAIPVPEIHEFTRTRTICTKCGKVCIEEPCTCMVNRAVNVPRVQNCPREEVVFEECKKTIDYCVLTPKFHKVDCGEETYCVLEPVVKTRKVQVCVPEAIKVPCEVCVTRMVAKKILCCEECWCEMQKRAAKEAKHKKDCKK